MKTISICKFYFNGNLVGESPVPDYSTREVRREIAKHMGIMQYDSATITNYELGEKVGEGITVNFLESELLDVRKEAEPIIQMSVDLGAPENPGMTTEKPLTPTDQIRSNYKPQNAPQETGQPEITRPISKEKL